MSQTSFFGWTRLSPGNRCPWLLALALPLGSWAAFSVACQAAETTPAEVPTAVAAQTRAVTGSAERNLEPAVRIFDPAIQQMMDQHGTPGTSVVILRKGAVIYDRGFGFADVEARKPVAHDSRFRIASVSKPITATAVLQLLEQGKLRLEDRVFEFLELQQYVPADHELDVRWREVTLAQLLSHTGGWDRGVSFDPMFIPERVCKELSVSYPVGPWEIIRYMVRQPLDFNPGEKYAYSNFGYSMLGRVIEKASGQPYATYVQREIFGRLGIDAAVIGKSRIEDRGGDEVRYYPQQESEEIAVVGAGAGEIKLPRQYGGWHHEALDAVGGWCLTAEEMARFGAAVACRQDSPLLKAETIEQMLTPCAPILKEGDSQPPTRHYCQGWVYTDAGPELRWHDHSGGLPGTSSALIILADGTTLAIVSNGGKTDIPAVAACLQKLVEELPAHP